METQIFFYYFNLVSGVALALIGSIGNLLVIAVYSRKSLRKYSMSRYMMALAVSDTVELISTVLLACSGMYAVDTVYCKALGSTVLMFFQLCSNIITFEHIDRTLTIFYGSGLSSKDSTWFQVSAVVIAVLISCPYGGIFAYKYDIVSFENGTVTACDVPDIEFQSIAQAIVAVTVTVIPFFILMTCTCIIIKGLVDSNRKLAKAKVFTKREMYLFKTMVATNLFFLVCNLPLAVYLILTNFMPSLYDFYVFTIMCVIANLHNSFPFLVYILSNYRFRRHFVAMFSRATSLSWTTTTTSK